MQVDAAQHLDRAVAAAQALDVQQGGHADSCRSRLAAQLGRRAMAQVGLDHGRVGRHLGGRSLRDQLPLRQHPHVLGQVHHGLHHVLDHQHRHARLRNAAHHRHHLADLLRVQPGQHLVEQQQLRLGRQRPGQFQPLAPGHREVGRGLVELRRQAHALRHGLGRGQRGHPSRLVQVRADGDVLAHGLRREGLHDLEGARQPLARIEVGRAAGDVLPVELNAAAVGNEEARHQREQRGLARAVGADQRRETALRHRQAHVLHRPEAAKTAGHAGQRHQRGTQYLAWLRASAPFHELTARTLRPRPPRPRGANMIISTSTTP